MTDLFTFTKTAVEREGRIWIHPSFWEIGIMSSFIFLAGNRNARQSRIGSWNRRGRRTRTAFNPAVLLRLEDRQLLSTFTVTSTGSDATVAGTLPWAINQVNADTGPFPDTIDFNIPGTGPFTIEPGAQLLSVNNPVVIDGYSQPSSSPNTLAEGDNAVIQISLSGLDGGFQNGLTLGGGDSVVEGISITNYVYAIYLQNSGGDTITGNFLGTDPSGESSQSTGSVGIFVNNVGGNTLGGSSPDARNIIGNFNNQGILLTGSNSAGNFVAGNYIGLDATGTSALGNDAGVAVTSDSGRNTIGGPQAGAGNLISGNSSGGALIDDTSSDNLIQGNSIGTNAAGNAAIPNGSPGFSIIPGILLNGTDNTVGGITPGSGNLISGNGADGIDIVGSSALGNLVEGNLIGTAADGMQPLGNQEGGISIFFGAAENTIGGLAAGAGNVIANNSRIGVNVGVNSGDNCPGNTILSNSIFNNAPLGIDLGFDGVTLNTPGAHTSGPNNLQNFPVVNTAVSFSGTSTVVVGTLNSGANSTFTLQFFANPAADPSGYGQGQTLLGTTSVTTDSNGNASFDFASPVVAPAGYVISATATDSTGDTSEFAQDVVTVAGTPPVQAGDDSYYANENTTLTVPAPGVQSNDVSADGGVFTSVLVSSASDGTVTLNPDGSFFYTPDADFVGIDSFTYEDMENGQTSNVATVTLLVNPLTLTVTNTLDDGSPGSLPWAINIANSDPATMPVTIDFDIPGSGPFVIQPTVPLPAITRSVIINGYSQPGASPNTVGQGDNAVIMIDLNGSSISGNDGLDIEGGNSVVEGLAIGSFSNAIHLESLGGDLVSGNFLGTDLTGENSASNSLGVLIDNVAGNTIGGLTPDALNVISGNNEGVQLNGSGATSNLIIGNYIGTDLTGTNRLPNGMGLEIENGSWGNTVGGDVSGAGNLVSGNNGDAIKIDGGCYDNVVQGNLVGTDVTDSTALVNFGKGVDINGNNNTIGGTTPGSGNVLSGNSSNGIVLVFNSATGNLMEGNSIGTNLAGTIAIPNQADGIQLFFSASNNTIGGMAAGAGNIIADNQGEGVTVGLGTNDSCVGDVILSNSIFGNSQIGIDLGNDGVTLNSPGSPHTGANNLQSFPVLNEAVAFTGVSTVIIGSLNSSPSATFTIQFFMNPSADPSGYGQGQTLLGTTTVTTDASGNTSFQDSLPVVVPSGSVISATATDSSGDTSEFAQDVSVVAAAPPIAALNDSYNTDINTTLTVAAPGVQANDVASNGGPFTSILVSSPTHGTLTFQTDGSFTYVPKAGYTGPDSFTYKDDQSGQYSNVATVSISVNPKTLYVTNTSSTGPGSLFEAISIASTSNSAGADAILFKIPGTGPFEISLTQALPALTHATIINGYSQTGAHTNSATIGDNAVIEIQVDGGNLPNGSTGLELSSSGITVEGLAVTRFTNGIVIQGPGSDLIAGNFVGVNASGTGFGWGNQTGILVTGGSANNIGGSVANRNVIAANNQQGIMLEGGASADKIASNYIGTDVSGVNRVNNGTGIALYDSPNNTIGGIAVNAGNLISGNNNDGVLVSSQNNGPGSTGTVIQGNFIGIDATGSIGVGNGNNGVHVVFGAGTVVGGLTASARNIISGNQAGVYLENSATGVLIENNYIGTDARGFKAIPNQFDGVLLSGTLNTVGGTTAKAANLISGNGRNGVSDGSFAGSIGQNTIQGNLIGTDSSGSVALPNGADGVDINTTGDTIGGTTTAAGNAISGNGQFGIRLSGNAQANVIEGNNIGTASSGSSAVGNTGDGIHIQDNSNNNTIGGTATGSANVIDFNGGTGVSVNDNAQFNAILTNSIYSNGNLGISLSGNGNQNLQPPVLASAVTRSKKTTIAGSLTGFAANTVYLIQFFANATADPSGFGEGQKYLGSLQVTTDGNGNSSFQVVLNVSVSAAQFVSATATDPTNNTSSFAADVKANSSTAAVVAPSAAISPAPQGVDATAMVSSARSLSPVSANQNDAAINDLAVDQVLANPRPVVSVSRRREDRMEILSKRHRVFLNSIKRRPLSARPIRRASDAAARAMLSPPTKRISHDINIKIRETGV